MGLYPGLVVWDGRVTGSITVGRSRLPLWAICTTAIRGHWSKEDASKEHWGSVESGWGDTYGFTDEDFAHFIYCLMEMRGEFGRLLLVLANAERADLRFVWPSGWWTKPTVRRRVRQQLQRCIEALDALDEPQEPDAEPRSPERAS